MIVLERGWLSSNNILFIGQERCALVDTGYATHAPQTLSLIQHHLQERQLTDIVNTHLHSDHCGGNALLQSVYRTVRTWVPESIKPAVDPWDPEALGHGPTGQTCLQFNATHGLRPDEQVLLGDECWRVIHAPGHDPDAVMLFHDEQRDLISADALWENGFGVVFPELSGCAAFDAVGNTLDEIEKLQPLRVIPGHGRPFHDVDAAVSRARSRLQYFAEDPRRHASYGGKVLIKFHMLEVQTSTLPRLIDWCKSAPHLCSTHRHFFSEVGLEDWIRGLLEQLARTGAIRLESGIVVDAG